MSLEAGCFRLLLVDLLGRDAGRWPVGPLAASLGAGAPEQFSIDDRGCLELLLAAERGRRKGALILTFGRISCGADDWAPEATGEAADSLLPALATALRLLWIERHPEAYLFRNIAAVLGSSLVVNLPADAALVDEAAEFLAKVCGHALEKIAGADAECGR